MGQLTFDGIGKVYPDGHRAVIDLNLEVDSGEFMVLVGPSGCGKTTALRMVAGLEAITEGELRIDGIVVNAIEPRKRDIAMVFQNYAIYPHMSIFENIAFPLRSQRLPRDEIRRRVEEVAALLDLTDLLKRKPRTLSGGQRQRVAMGRAFVRRPQVFLMDEPLSNLDAKLRVQMRAEIARLQRQLGVTTLYVTHDQVEAMTMGTRVAIMRNGVLQQVGPPQEVYERPDNLFVATFIGSPAMNLARARLERSEGIVLRLNDSETIALGDAFMDRHPGLLAYVGKEVTVGMRPEHLADAELDPGAAVISADVTLVETLGSERLIHFEIDGAPVVTDEIVELAQDQDATLVHTLESEAETHRVPMVARVGVASRIARGPRARIAVDVDELHFFDLQTGRAVGARRGVTADVTAGSAV